MSDLSDIISGVTATRRERTLEDLPGPPRLPLLGNLLQLNVDHAHTVMERWAEECGDFYRLRLGRADAVVISAPPLIDRILKDRPGRFTRIQIMRDAMPQLGLN